MTDQLILSRRLGKDTVQSLAQIYAKTYGSRDEMEEKNKISQMFIDNHDFQKVCDIAVNIQTGAYGTQLKLEF